MKKIFSKDQIGTEARHSINGQRHRCNCETASDYKYYGAKGIQVEYTSEEFFKWFKKEREKIPLYIKVNVDRINHDDNYRFGNIQLVPKTENVIDSNQRRSSYDLYDIIWFKINGFSQRMIAEHYSGKQGNVSKYLKRRGIKWKNLK